MAITKSGTIVSVEYEPGGIGSSWVNAYYWSDIVAASDAGGWGMTYQDNTYFIPWSIHLEPDTHLRIYESGTDMVLVFNCPAAWESNYWFYSKPGSHLIVGADAGYNDIRPVTMRADPDAITNSLYRRLYFAGEVTLVNSVFYNGYYGYLIGDSDSLLAQARNCRFINFQFGLNTTQYTVLENVFKTGGYYGFTANGVKSADNVLVEWSNIALLVTGGDMTMRNIKINTTDTRDFQIRCKNMASKFITFVDCELDKTKYAWYNSGGTDNSMNEVALKSTFNFYVTDEDGVAIDGASVKIYGDEDTLLLDDTVDGNGELLGEEVTYFYAYRQTTAVDYTDGETDYEPLRIEISKAPFKDMGIYEIYIDPGKPTTIRATMYLHTYADPAPNVELEDEPTTISIIEVETE